MTLETRQLKQGELVAPHVNAHVDEMLIVLEGEVAFECGDKSVVAGAGSMIFAPRGQTRSWKAVGSREARTMACVYPSRLELPVQ